jgi:TfoX/Sxy family transcriptional regulator of competence genes
MKLNEFNMKPAQAAKKALKEHFNTELNVDGLGLYDTNRMLRKVKGLISEARTNGKASEQNATYLKAVFMEQALTHHYGELKAMPMYNQRMVVENEEVEKSQVILAAQEMVDSIQKMVEQVSDMLVKELPAVVDGVNSEVGTNEGQQFNDQVSQALTSLQAALTGSKTGIQGALNTITGQGAGLEGGLDAGMAPPEMGGEELGGELGGDEMGGEELGGEELPAELPAEEPEPEANVGRTVR